MQARTKSPIYARLDYEDGNDTIGLTDPWHGRVKRCAESLERLDSLPISLRSSLIAGRSLSGVGFVTDTISIVIGGAVIEFTIYEVAQWVAEYAVTLVKDAFVSASPAKATIEASTAVKRG